MIRQIESRVAKLEEADGNLAPAIRHWEPIKAVTFAPQLAEEHIVRLRQMMNTGRQQPMPDAAVKS